VPSPGRSRFAQETPHDPSRSRRNRHEPSHPTFLQLYRRERAVLTPSSSCPLSFGMRAGGDRQPSEEKKKQGMVECGATTADRTDVVVSPPGVASIPGHPEDCADQHASDWTLHVHGSRVTVVLKRTRCGSTEAAPAAIGPEATCASHYQLSYPLRSKEVWDKSLGQPAHRTPKGERDQSMPVKWGQVRSANRTPRETRVTRSRLDCCASCYPTMYPSFNEEALGQ
jgi:hypothetical protein